MRSLLVGRDHVGGLEHDPTKEAFISLTSKVISASALRQRHSALYIFLVLDLLWLPGRPMFQYGIENGQKLMHARRQGDFFDFPRREEPLVKSVDLRVGARGHQRAHRQHGAHMS